MTGAKSDAWVGRIIDARYQLVRLIGRGGMGEVYEAMQLELARPVAVKLLLDCDERAVARFRQEALLLATISHPNVVQVTDLVSDDDLPAAIVMELLDGEPLRKILGRDRRLNEESAVAVTVQMLAGLAAAHERGIVHRDVKPSNVHIVRPAHGPEIVKMLDFGVAKSLDAGGLRTTMGVSVGTPAYMAPEQILGDAIDARTDLYAVGACLYEMLAGERAAGSAKGPSIQTAVLDLDLARLVETLQGSPLAHVVVTAMARDPDARYPNAGAMIAALEAASPSTAARRISTSKGQPQSRPPALPESPVPEVPREGTRYGKSLGASGTTKPAEVGDVVASKYRVNRVLATGGMGLVVLAHHLNLDQQVALKFLHRSAASDSVLVERFMREARSSVRLKSPHVARTLDTGRLDDGWPYIVMEYLDGRDLEGELRSRGGPLSVEEAVTYVLQACDAVSEAHSLGIIHRDLKPANLFLTRGHDGRAHIKVLDFGISKTIDLKATGPIAEEQTALTNAEMVFGSAAYMSPEQARSTKDVDARSDIWSVGVVLYELLTARLPFEAPLAIHVALKARRDDPTRPRAHRPEIPELLDGIVLRCLEKDPDRRFPNVGELAHALAPFAHPRDRGIAERVADISRGGSSASVAIATGPVSIEAEPAGKRSSGRVVALAIFVVALALPVFWLFVHDRGGAEPAAQPVIPSLPAPPVSSPPLAPAPPDSTGALSLPDPPPLAPPSASASRPDGRGPPLPSVRRSRASPSTPSSSKKPDLASAPDGGRYYPVRE